MLVISWTYLVKEADSLAIPFKIHDMNMHDSAQTN